MNYPKNVNAILESINYDEDSIKEAERIVSELNQIGWDADYDMEGNLFLIRRKFSLESTSICLASLKPIGKFRFTFNRVNSNAKWKLSTRDCTLGPLHLPFGMSEESQDEFQEALSKAGTDVLMLETRWGNKYYTFTGTIAEIAHPKIDRYVECMKQGIEYEV